MKESTRMVFDDPSKFSLLATQVKLDVIQAGKDTVNIMAAKATKEAKQNIRKNFTTRNTFTANSVRFTPMPDSKYIKLSEIHSIVGILDSASYMARQEEGGEHTPRQGEKLAIPTDIARGGSFKNRVLRGKQVKDIRNKRRRVHGSVSAKRTKKSMLVARAYIARKHNLFLPMGFNDEERDVYMVLDFNTFGRGKKRKVRFKKDMVYNFHYSKTLTKAKPWLMPACEKVAKDAQKIFNSQMQKLEK